MTVVIAIAVIVILALIVAVALSALARRREERAARERAKAERFAFIASYAFPSGVAEGVAAAYPSLSRAQVAQVIEGLRHWFVACAHADGKRLGMPSKAVDEAWHAFLLDSRRYEDFCQRAFGRTLHHIPEEDMRATSEHAHRATLATLDRHQIGLDVAAGVPLLFAIDGLVGVGEPAHAETIDGWRHERDADRGSYVDGGAGYGGDPGDSGGGGGDGGGGGCGGGGCGSA